jgi:hypothetical protein
MPVIRLGGQDTELDEEIAEEEEAEAEEDEPMEDAEQESEPFVGQELDTMLKTAEQTNVVMRDVGTKDKPLTFDGATSAGQQVPAVAEEDAQPEPTAKRPHAGETPLSPAKRVRFGGAESGAAPTMPPAANVAVPPVKSTNDSEVPATSDFTVTSTASVIPDLPVPGEGGDDSDDDDDVVPLVFGQDTDDESD